MQCIGRSSVDPRRYWWQTASPSKIYNTSTADTATSLPLPCSPYRYTPCSRVTKTAPNFGSDLFRLFGRVTFRSPCGRPKGVTCGHCSRRSWRCFRSSGRKGVSGARPQGEWVMINRSVRPFGGSGSRLEGPWCFRWYLTIVWTPLIARLTHNTDVRSPWPAWRKLAWSWVLPTVVPPPTYWLSAPRR